MIFGGGRGSTVTFGTETKSIVILLPVVGINGGPVVVVLVPSKSKRTDSLIGFTNIGGKSGSERLEIARRKNILSGNETPKSTRNFDFNDCELEAARGLAE